VRFKEKMGLKAIFLLKIFEITPHLLPLSWPLAPGTWPGRRAGARDF